MSQFVDYPIDRIYLSFKTPTFEVVNPEGKTFRFYHELQEFTHLKSPPHAKIFIDNSGAGHREFDKKDQIWVLLATYSVPTYSPDPLSSFRLEWLNMRVPLTNLRFKVADWALKVIHSGASIPEGYKITGTGYCPVCFRKLSDHKWKGREKGLTETCWKRNKGKWPEPK